MEKHKDSTLGSGLPRNYSDTELREWDSWRTKAECQHEDHPEVRRYYRWDTSLHIQELSAWQQLTESNPPG